MSAVFLRMFDFFILWYRSLFSCVRFFMSVKIEMFLCCLVILLISFWMRMVLLMSVFLKRFVLLFLVYGFSKFMILMFVSNILILVDCCSKFGVGWWMG